MDEVFELITVRNALSLLIFVFLFGYVVFAFLLFLRIRILAKTLETIRSGFVVLLANAHFLMVLIGSIVVALLILI